MSENAVDFSDDLSVDFFVDLSVLSFLMVCLLIFHLVFFSESLAIFEISKCFGALAKSAREFRVSHPGTADLLAHDWHDHNQHD